MTNTRLIAARVINCVSDGKSLSDSLDKEFKTLKDSRDRALVQAICFGVCRYYTRLDIILSFLLKKPMKAKDSLIHALLLVGLYQLLYMRVPPHASVSETVNATSAFNQTWVRGFVNAILREFLRKKAEILQEIQTDEEAEFSHPQWLINTIKKNYPTQYADILHANNAHPPFSLRVNQQKITRDEYLKKLQQEEISAHLIPETSAGIILNIPLATENLPGFLQGEVSVQDGAAQLAAEILQITNEDVVLDACASPGGKLTHLLEIAPNARVFAIEKDPKRIPAINENLSRLQLHASIICKDAGDTESWWNGELFDCILLDAPCSASGVIRRHPDIKLLRQPKDMIELSKEQLRLMQALWPLLKIGGKLLYVTCSIFKDENVQVMQQFLKEHLDAVEEKIHKTCGIPAEIGLQILPGVCELDGFYFALFQKISL